MNSNAFFALLPVVKALAFETGYAATSEAGYDDMSWKDIKLSAGPEKTSPRSSSASSSSLASSVDWQKQPYYELLERVASLEKNVSSLKQAMADKQRSSISARPLCPSARKL